MIISALLEAQEKRVAITPNAAKNYLKAGHSVIVEKNAGLAAGFSDAIYEEEGVLLSDKNSLLAQTHILVSLNPPPLKDICLLPEKALIITHVDKNPHDELVSYCLQNKISLFSMNLIPRISRAQNIDSLSSQANLAGYRAVLEATHYFSRAVPMMMTAAGMIQPAKVLILGAGVAGLQAIATAKRLGAVVYAFDVRQAAKEQVESLGAEFIEVSAYSDSESKAGYATETSDEYKRLQAALIEEYAKKADIIITTALIPGKKAPLLLPQKTVDGMKPGSVIVDLATSQGGNCEISLPDEVKYYRDITIIGWSHMAGLIPTTASELYANNLHHLIHLFAKPSQLEFDETDEIIQQALLCHEGRYLPFQSDKAIENA